MDNNIFQLTRLPAVKWDEAALKATIEQVQFMHNATVMVTDFYFNQVKKVREWQEHIWEIL
jgi:hypothetical protein